MAYTYDAIFAVDPNAPSNVARNASITLFDPADATQAPVTITDPTGVPLPNPITVDAQGMGPAFQHATLARLGWKGAGFTGYFTSYEGMYNETVAAKEAAENAAGQAQSAAGTTVTAAGINPDGRLVLSKADGTSMDVGVVIGPQGDKGDKGADGSNVLPTDAAIKQAIEDTTSATRGALNVAVAPVSLAVRGNQPVAPQERVISSFDSGHGWTVSAGFASTNLNDATAAVLGTQGISGTTAGTGAGNTFDSPDVTAFNPAGKQYVADIIVSDPTKLRSLQLFVGNSAMTNSTGMYGIHTTINPRGKLLANVPYRVIFSAGASPQIVGTGAGTAAVKYRFRVQDESNGAVTVKIGGLSEYTPTTAFPNGVVSIGFDDSWSPQYYLPSMQRRRFRGTIYPVLDQLDVAGKLSTATVMDLSRKYGWDIGCHASSVSAHSGYPTMTAAQVEAEVQTVKKWLVERGLTGQSYATPGGAWSTTIEAITERYFRTNRTSGSGREYLPPPRPQSMRSITVLNTHTLAELTARVDEAYANAQLLDLCFHQVLPTNASNDAYTWLSADFESLLSYIATKGIPVLPIGHVLNKLAG